MSRIQMKYNNFINEALVYQMRRGDYVLCGGNFAKVSPVKGKYAKIITSTSRRDDKGNLKHYYTLEFETELVDKRSGQEVRSTTIEISSSQIKNLTPINGVEYERIKAGFTMKYEASPTFVSVLKNINFNIRYKTYDVSYFDYSNDVITFLPANKNDVVPDDEKYTSKQRQSSKIGRILAKLNDSYTAPQIESFGNQFKAVYKMITEDMGDKLRVITGDLITYWYYEGNYVPGQGTLNKSCMRYANVKDRVAFYSKNPDKIAMCILVDDKNKLLARAIIWKLDSPPNTIFMDRIYYNQPVHELILADYAKEHNMKTKLSGFHNNNILEVDIKSYKQGDNLPYLDTLHWNPLKKLFANR